MKVSFRNVKAQARHVAEQLTAHGIARHNNKRDAKIHSVGTDRSMQASLAVYAQWLAEERRGTLREATRDDAYAYLQMRSEEVQQSTLNADRQALNRCLSVAQPGTAKLPVVKSELETVRGTRAYTEQQVKAIMAAQSEKHAITTELAFRCGIRAHEAYSLLPSEAQPRSMRRAWREDLQAGREDHLVYSCRGKGGLIRYTFIPPDLAERLEARRREPIQITDRNIHYVSHYDIAGGQNASQSFAAASKRVLGWSTGFHGCRHSFLSQAMEKLQSSGYSYSDSRQICSQLAGHFREIVVEIYLI